MKFILAKAFITNKIWVEAISDESIVWTGIPGWNFYYRISGIICCDWTIMLYNNTYKLCYYRNEYIEGECDNVDLRISHKISGNNNILGNIFMYNLSAASSTPPIQSSSILHRDYLYFCEPPILDHDINSIFKSFNYTILDDDNNNNDMSVVNNDQLLLNTNMYHKKKCHYHPKPKYIRNVIIHSKDKVIQFSIVNNSFRNVCTVCNALSCLKKQYNNKSILFDSMTSSLILNY